EGLDLSKLELAALSRLPEESFGPHLRLLRPERSDGDQLTRELRHFVQCVRSGAAPRVRGEDGREAVALAARILSGLREYPGDSPTRGLAAPWYRPLEGDAAA